MKYIAILLTMFLLKSCGNTKDVASLRDNKNNQQIETVSGTYLITKLGAIDNLALELTLKFDENTGKISGFSGCNRFFGTYQKKKDFISFSQLGSTRKMCQDEANNLENHFLETLDKITNFKLKAGVLTLLKNTNPLIIANTKQEHIVITYQALSRGFFEEISVTKDTFTISYDRNRKLIKSYKHDIKDWNECLALLSLIKVEDLPNIKAPTSMRLYDGAAHATLTIKSETKEIKSNSFDHGYPPTEIKALVEKLLSFKKTVSKQ